MKLTKRLLSIALTAILLLSTIITAGASTDGVEINSENFPDKYMRKYIANTFDMDDNKVLSTKELKSVKSFWLPKKIGNLKGIEYFTEITKITSKGTYEDDQSYPINLEKIDFSILPKLKKIKLDLTNEPHMEINLSGLKKLEEVSIISEIFEKGYDYGYNWAYIDSKPDKRPYKSIDLTNTPALKSLSVTNCEKIILDKKSPIKNLYFANIDEVNTEVIPSYDLKTFYSNCNNSKIAKLDFSKQKSLKEFTMTNKNLTKLDISSAKNLKALSLESKALKKIRLAKSVPRLCSVSLSHVPINNFSWIPKKRDNLFELELYDIPIERLSSKSFPELGIVTAVGCKKLKTINLDAVKNKPLVWQANISDNPKLEKIILPKTIEYLIHDSLDDCKKLKKLVIKSVKAPEIAYEKFYYVPSSLKIYVPKNATGYYKYPWARYATIYGTKAQSEKTCKAMEKKVKNFTPKFTSEKSFSENETSFHFCIEPVWKTSPGMTDYKLYYSTSKNGKYKAFYKYNGKRGDSSILFKVKFKPGKYYYFKLRGLRKVGTRYAYSKFSKVTRMKCY